MRTFSIMLLSLASLGPAWPTFAQPAPAPKDKPPVPDRPLPTLNMVVPQRESPLFALSGTSGFKESSPMQQKWRDIHMMASHVSFTRANLQHYGRIALGLERDPKLVVF